MTSRRTATLVAAAILAVTVAGYAWSEKAASESREATTLSGRCPVSGGSAGGSCPYLARKAQVDGANSTKNGREGSRDPRGVCPYSGKSRNADPDGVHATIRAVGKNV
jgi:hypothetical protein